MKGKIFLVRHAAYSGDETNPSLSERGKQQSSDLAQKIKANINGGSTILWSSSANRARETAEIIKEELELPEMVIEEKLWSDNDHWHDFKWLKEKLEAFEGDTLIIVSHLEYVQDFPEWIGFDSNRASYAQGVKIENGECDNF